MLKITHVELKLYLRDWVNALFVFVLPIGLLIVLGNIPVLREPSEEGGQSLADSHLPAVMTLIALGILSVVSLPTYLATYRHQGVLRRLSATPARPQAILLAQLLVHLAVGVIAAALVVTAGSAIVGTAIPSPIGWFVLTVLLGTASLLAVGLLIGALAPNGSAATGIGNAVMFPLFFLGGVWFPREAMPDALGTVSDLSPMGPFVLAMRATWLGEPPQPRHLLIMAAYGVVAGALAIRLFRWA